MVKQCTVRFGRNYQVKLAIVLPSILIVPFIWSMVGLHDLKEWEIWIYIFTFLGCIISLSIWLTLRVYPKITLSINGNLISFSFDQNRFLSPQDFSFNSTDIISFSCKAIMDNEYYIFKTINPSRKFQVSSATYELQDLLSFNEARIEIGEMVNSKKENKEFF